MTVTTPRRAIPNQRSGDRRMVTALLQAGRGNRGAFAEIYARYVDMVYRFIYFRVKNREVAEDLTADTFMRALQNSHRWHDVGRDPGAWLITIARNLVADHWKCARSRLERPIGFVLDAETPDRPELATEASVLAYLSSLELIAAVRQLVAEQRECIILRFLKGYSVAETARAMGKSDGAIKALQYRAMTNLRHLLQSVPVTTQPRKEHNP